MTKKRPDDASEVEEAEGGQEAEVAEDGDEVTTEWGTREYIWAGVAWPAFLVLMLVGDGAFADQAPATSTLFTAFGALAFSLAVPTLIGWRAPRRFFWASALLSPCFLLLWFA